MQNFLKFNLLLQDYMSNSLIPFWNSYSLFQTLSRCSLTHLCWLDVLHYLFTCFLQTVEKSKTYCIIFKSANIVMVISYRDTREALYFCVTLTEQLFLQIWRVDLNYFLDRLGTGIWSDPVMQNFFSNLAPSSGGDEGANSGGPWYMKYAGKAAGIGGGLGKFF